MGGTWHPSRQSPMKYGMKPVNLYRGLTQTTELRINRNLGVPWSGKRWDLCLKLALNSILLLKIFHNVYVWEIHNIDCLYQNIYYLILNTVLSLLNRALANPNFFNEPCKYCEQISITILKYLDLIHFCKYLTSVIYISGTIIFALGEFKYIEMMLPILLDSNTH